MTVRILDRNVIPQCSAFGQPTGVVAVVNTIDRFKVYGLLRYHDGIDIPFEVNHDHTSFQVGTGGPRFYFKDWTKQK